MSSQKGETVTVHMKYGDPNGYRTAELPSRNFHAIAFPRVYMGQLKGKALESLSRGGVYILVGPMTSKGKRDAYIGESSRSVNARLRKHNNPKNKEYKEFWESAVIITTRSNEANSKTKYIEGELMRHNETNKNWSIINDNFSSYELKDLSNSDEYFVLEFVDASKVLLACLGYDFLCEPLKKSSRSPLKSASETTGKPNRITKFICRGLGGVHAEMTIGPNGSYVVSKGSIARGRLAWSMNQQKRSERQELIDSKILKEHGDNFIFTKDYAFHSVSSAATQVMGSVRNGNQEWKIDGKGKTYGEWKNLKSSRAKK